MDREPLLHDEILEICRLDLWNSSRLIHLEKLIDSTKYEGRKEGWRYEIGEGKIEDRYFKDLSKDDLV